MKSQISILLDILTGGDRQAIPTLPTDSRYIKDERIIANGVKSFDDRLKVQMTVVRGGWRTIQVYVVISGFNVVVLELPEIIDSSYPHSPLGFMVPNVDTVVKALNNLLVLDPSKRVHAKVTVSDAKSGVDVTEL